MMYPKPARVRSKSAIEAARKEWCESCGRPAYAEPHHVVTVGAGGPDHRFNLIQLCGDDHTRAHSSDKNRLTADRLLAIVAMREGMLLEDVKREINRLRGRG